jgi:hypothetical protein
MNNVSFYFRDTINSQKYAYVTLNKLYQAGAEKYVACCIEFKAFHSKTDFVELVDLKICESIYVVIRSFFKYLVCNVRNPVFQNENYCQFFMFSLSFFVLKFQECKNTFAHVFRILKSKMEKLQTEPVTFAIR